MTPAAVRDNIKCPSPIVTGAARPALLHLYHRNVADAFRGGIDLVVAVRARQPQFPDMQIMAVYDITSISYLKGDVTTTHLAPC